MKIYNDNRASRHSLALFNAAKNRVRSTTVGHYGGNVLHKASFNATMWRPIRQHLASPRGNRHNGLVLKKQIAHC